MQPASVLRFSELIDSIPTKQRVVGITQILYQVITYGKSFSVSDRTAIIFIRKRFSLAIISGRQVFYQVSGS